MLALHPTGSCDLDKARPGRSVTWTCWTTWASGGVWTYARLSRPDPRGIQLRLVPVPLRPNPLALCLLVYNASEPPSKLDNVQACPLANHRETQGDAKVASAHRPPYILGHVARSSTPRSSTHLGFGLPGTGWAGLAGLDLALVRHLLGVQLPADTRRSTRARW